MIDSAPPDSEPAPNETDFAQPKGPVADRYALMERIGQGAESVVYEAYDLDSGQRVALKLPLPRGPVTEDFRGASLSREASIGLKLEHPHLLQLLDHGIWENRPYLVMERLHGETLSQRLRGGRRLSLQETCELVCQVASALGAMHQQRLVHRDIKPSNLFLLGELDRTFVKVMDFGITKMALSDATITAPHTSLGSPRYMSPEQFREGGTVDQRADLWALAAVAYRALVGVPCFRGRDLFGVAQAVLERNYVKPSALDGALAPMDAWFAKAFAERRDKRFQSAQELAASLTALVNKAEAPEAIAFRNPAPEPQRAEAPTLLSIEVAWQDPSEPRAELDTIVNEPGPQTDDEIKTRAWHAPPLPRPALESVTRAMAAPAKANRQTPPAPPPPAPGQAPAAAVEAGSSKSAGPAASSIAPWSTHHGSGEGHELGTLAGAGTWSGTHPFPDAEGSIDDYRPLRRHVSGPMVTVIGVAVLGVAASFGMVTLSTSSPEGSAASTAPHAAAPHAAAPKAYRAPIAPQTVYETQTSRNASAKRSPTRPGAASPTPSSSTQSRIVTPKKAAAGARSATVDAP